MADASDMCATEHRTFSRVEAGKAPNSPDPRVGVDAGTVEPTVVMKPEVAMKPEVLDTLAAVKPVKDGSGTVA